jgi:hypothetical protein
MWLDNGLNAQCKGFKCIPGHVYCCCRRLLFLQSDFIAQKSQLEEYITSHGHLCDFYPKFHCELNFIEQYWGTVKFHYCSSPKTSDMDAIAMEKNILTCLEAVALLHIRRWGLLSNLSTLSWAYIVADLQIGQVDLFLPTHKACPVLRLCGQTTDIMAIVSFPQTWYKRQNLLKSRISIIIIANLY